MPRDLHALPRLSDRWSHLYLEHGRLQKTKEGLGFVDPQGGMTAVPLDQFAVILLGPGTTLTHAAARTRRRVCSARPRPGPTRRGAWPSSGACTANDSSRRFLREPRSKPFARWRASACAPATHAKPPAWVSIGRDATTIKVPGTEPTRSIARSQPRTRACTASATRRSSPRATPRASVSSTPASSFRSSTISPTSTRPS